jgi:hypothetical protein
MPSLVGGRGPEPRPHPLVKVILAIANAAGRDLDEPWPASSNAPRLQGSLGEAEKAGRLLFRQQEVVECMGSLHPSSPFEIGDEPSREMVEGSRMCLERATTRATFFPFLHTDTEAEMRPLQVWLPAFDAEVLTDALWRDLGRAQQQWRGETTVWLLPRLKEVVRWGTPERLWSTEVAIPAETLNRIDVFHIGDNGYLHGSGRYPRFFSASTGNLLDSWLNLLDKSEEHGIQLRSCLVQLELHCGLSIPTIEEAYDSGEFQKIMGEQVVVRRAIGVQGLIWCLLINRLEEGLAFRSCAQCGRIISNRKGKRFCGSEEGSGCFKRRRAADKRRERKASAGR